MRYWYQHGWIIIISTNTCRIIIRISTIRIYVKVGYDCIQTQIFVFHFFFFLPVLDEHNNFVTINVTVKTLFFDVRTYIMLHTFKRFTLFSKFLTVLSFYNNFLCGVQGNIHRLNIVLVAFSPTPAVVSKSQNC